MQSHWGSGLQPVNFRGTQFSPLQRDRGKKGEREREGGRERQRERQRVQWGEGRREEPVALDGDPDSWSWASFAIHLIATLSKSLFPLLPQPHLQRGSAAPHTPYTLK